MNARAFHLESDFVEINRWQELRGGMPIDADTLPVQGVIVPGVAVGFLYRTDSSLAFLDGFLSNPEAPSAERGAALLHIGNTLSAQWHGRHLIVYTENPGISRYCRENGYTDRGSMRLFTKDR